MSRTILSCSECERLALSGRAAAVDILVRALGADNPVQVRVADYALGLVESEEGVLRIRHHLFFAPLPVQRNHLALYFKRRGLTEVLEEAVKRGCIDAIQAWSR